MLIEITLALSRRNRQDGLSECFTNAMENRIKRWFFLPPGKPDQADDGIILRLTNHHIQARIPTTAVGISGGVDIALTSPLLKCACLRVMGNMLPIEQDPEKTARTVGVLGLERHNIDLTDLCAQLAFPP